MPGLSDAWMKNVNIMIKAKLPVDANFKGIHHYGPKLDDLQNLDDEIKQLARKAEELRDQLDNRKKTMTDILDKVEKKVAEYDKSREALLRGYEKAAGKDVDDAVIAVLKNGLPLAFNQADGFCKGMRKTALKRAITID